MSTKLSANALEVLTYYRFRYDPLTAELPHAVLAEGTKELLEAGFIEVVVSQGDKVSYHLTEAGQNLALKDAGPT
jgi:DNA-binding HxlR family transcriptional regulator